MLRHMSGGGRAGGGGGRGRDGVAEEGEAKGAGGRRQKGGPVEDALEGAQRRLYVAHHGERVARLLKRGMGKGRK